MVPTASPGEISANLIPIHLVAWAGMGLLGLAGAGHALGAYLLAAPAVPFAATTPGAAPAVRAAGH